MLDIRQMTAMMDRDTEDIPVVLLTLTHPALQEPVRISTDNGDLLGYDEYDTPYFGTRSQGVDYVFCPVSLPLPSTQGLDANTGSIQIDNVTRILTPFIRSANPRDGLPKVAMQVVLVSKVFPESVDHPMMAYPELNVTNVNYNAASMTITLGVSTFDGEPFPGLGFMPSYFRSLFVK
jgi:hypothetical protein